MGGVEALFRRFHGDGGGGGPGAGYFVKIRAIGGDLRAFGRRGGSGRVDIAFDACARGVGGDGGGGVARRIHEHLLESPLLHLAHEHGGAPVLERAGGEEEIELAENFHIRKSEGNERRHALVHADDVLIRFAWESPRGSAKGWRGVLRGIRA